MNESDALALIRQTKSLVFTTREFAMLGNISITFASQMLRRLTAKNKLNRLYQGVWADTENPEYNVYLVTPFLTRPHPAAVSLLSALHLQGMIEQIPQTIYIVSTAPTKKVKTPVADYSIHQITPLLFTDYEFYRNEGNFLIASPEKALFDCAYFSARKGKRFSVLPEISFPKSFKQRKVFDFVKKIPFKKLRKGVERKLETWLEK
jgi:predicted transcriptional regulator of viral defense system